MAEKTNKTIKEGYERLKKVIKNLLHPQKDAMPQLILQPIRNNRASH